MNKGLRLRFHKKISKIPLHPRPSKPRPHLNSRIATKISTTQQLWKSMNKPLMNQKNLRVKMALRSNLSSKSMKLEVVMKAWRKMGIEMEKANFFTKMAATMMGNGRIIKCMDGGNCSTREENLPMKEIGLMMSSMGMERSITTILCLWIVDSITRTLIC